jgi:hypothetical protein
MELNFWSLFIMRDHSHFKEEEIAQKWPVSRNRAIFLKPTMVVREQFALQFLCPSDLILDLSLCLFISILPSSPPSWSCDDQNCLVESSIIIPRWWATRWWLDHRRQ